MAALGPRLQLPRQRTRSTEMSSAPAAASMVASASALPGRGDSSDAATKSVAARQVMHTMTVGRPAGPVSLIRISSKPKLGVRNRRESVWPIPARSSDSTVVRGTPPGTQPMRWQVSWLAGQCSLPPSQPVACGQHQWHQASARRLQLRGQPWVGMKRRETLDVYHIPSSLSRERETIESRSTTLRPHIVNAAPMHYPPRRCQVLEPTQWGWRVKRESGESASMAPIPELPPQR
jgi:hypothetical protein